MHETIVAQSLFNAILPEAQKLPGAKPVLAKISCGRLHPINAEVLSFALEAISKGTILEGIKLDLSFIEPEALCRKCSNKFGFDLSADRYRCDNCGSDDFEILPDAPITLEQIQFEEV